MEEWEYNHWIGYLMHEQEEHESQARMAQHGRHK